MLGTLASLLQRLDMESEIVRYLLIKFRDRKHGATVREIYQFDILQELKTGFMAGWWKVIILFKKNKVMGR